MAHVREMDFEMDDDEFEEYLTEIHGHISVGSYTFDTGTVIRKLDPIAFQLEKSGYKDRQGPMAYQCGICSEEYDNYEDAECCCENRAALLQAIEDHKDGQYDGIAVSDTSEVPEGYSGDVLLINDHGNATLFYSDSDGLTYIDSIV